MPTPFLRLKISCSEFQQDPNQSGFLPCRRLLVYQTSDTAMRSQVHAPSFPLNSGIWVRVDVRLPKFEVLHSLHRTTKVILKVHWIPATTRYKSKSSIPRWKGFWECQGWHFGQDDIPVAEGSDTLRQVEYSVHVDAFQPLLPACASGYISLTAIGEAWSHSLVPEINERRLAEDICVPAPAFI
jgi:hypothetical protein